MTVRRLATVALVVALLPLAACGREQVVAVDADSGLRPSSDGFSFANFGASASPAVFDVDDLVEMFGGGGCVDGVTDPCQPTAEAAAWARMVNQSRASGHCEGLVVQAAARFRAGESPRTGELSNDPDVTSAIIRAFATQFLPETQRESAKWARRSLEEIVNALRESFETGEESYSLGVYTDVGGHAVLPYAVEFPSKSIAIIKVYDSNWPGQDRAVIIDLQQRRWTFSFAGIDPLRDPCAWSGGEGDIDLTPLSARVDATCPFCTGKVKTKTSMLLIRSTTRNWSLKTSRGTYSPGSGAAVDGVHAEKIVRCQPLRACPVRSNMTCLTFVYSSNE